MRALTLRRYSERTLESYVSRMQDLARYYMRPPRDLNCDELQAYLYHLAYERKLSASTCNVAINALRLYYQLVEGIPRDQLKLMLPRPRSGWQLPEVLSVEEVERLIGSAWQPHHRTFLMLVYGTGLRLSEATNLRARHIDSDRMQIRVESGKGNKDRYTVLSPSLLGELRAHWKRCGCTDWLFRSKDGYGPACIATGQYAYKVAAKRAGITSVSRDNVTFRYKDYADGSKNKSMTLPGQEFLRRFLQHILPSDFVKVRHYGIFAHAVKAQALKKLHNSLKTQGHSLATATRAICALLAKTTAPPATQRCPACNSLALVSSEVMPVPEALQHWPQAP